MPSRSCFALCVIVLVTVPVVAQEKSLGDLAREVRAEKAQKAQPEDRADAVARPLAPNTAPVSAAQVLAWIVGGMSSAEVSAQIASRGIGFEPTAEFQDALRKATSDVDLMATIRNAHRPSGMTAPSNYQPLADAAMAFRQKEYESAHKIVAAALEADNQNADLCIAMGNLLKQKEQWWAMAQAYARAVRLDPGLAYAHGQLAYALYRLNDDRSEDEARKMLELEPNSADGHKFLGLAMDLQGQSQAALAEYAKSLSLHPNNAVVYFDIGLARSKMQDWEGAIEAYRHAVALDDTQADYQLNLGVTYKRSGRYEEAIAVYRRAVARFPDRLDLRQNLGGTLCNTGRYEEAIPELRELLRIDPTWNMARPCLYKALINTGRTAEAEVVRAEYLNTK